MAMYIINEVFALYYKPAEKLRRVFDHKGLESLSES